MPPRRRLTKPSAPSAVVNISGSMTPTAAPSPYLASSTSTAAKCEPVLPPKPGAGKQISKDCCLHCHAPRVIGENDQNSSGVQVKCDECSAFVCNDCHWCHEFQANHEIRACDRCDAFYCKSCDEMDQCDDCGEIVCAGCSTLLSCKFCGGGLCEDCAIACGRCGIVLCSRDAKFAVECDTCRLSYCLVCLASGSKDPCVRCGHRPSKRMEQLVHLRLKSIYKAFKQSSERGGGGGGPSCSSNYNSNSASSSSCSHFSTIHQNPNSLQSHSIFHSSPIKTSNAILRERHNDVLTEMMATEESKILLHAAAASVASAASKLNEAAFVSCGIGDEQFINLQSTNTGSSMHRASSRLPHFQHPSAIERMEDYMAEKAKADQAAADLLAELDEEEKKNSKKLKKKKKKEKHQNRDEFIAQPKAIERDELDDNQSPMEAETGHILASPSRDHFADMDLLANMQDTTHIESEHSSYAIEGRLEKLIEEEDIHGIEELLESIKGVPGRAALRKNAKKALKRLKIDAIERESIETMKQPEDPLGHGSEDSHKEAIVKQHTKLSSEASSEYVKVEWSLPIDPSLVGFVIGKGGQRIRDLMEESGTRIWIDQEGLTPEDTRHVTVSGYQNSVDTAKNLLIDLIAKHTKKIHGSVAVASELSKLIPEISDSSDFAKKPRGNDLDEVLKSSSFPQLDSAKSSQIVTCDPRFVPLLIGRRGWTIKNIQDSSGARVDIDQSVVPRRITVSGNENCVEIAVGMVRDVLSYPHSQLQGAADEHVDGYTEEECHHPLNTVSPVQYPPSISSIHPEDNDLDSDEVKPIGNAVPMASIVRNANSPPSSLIMTGDAKGTISASSSLSSTPEPSIVSCKTKLACAQVTSGPMLPPSFAFSPLSQLKAENKAGPLESRPLSLLFSQEYTHEIPTSQLQALPESEINANETKPALMSQQPQEQSVGGMRSSHLNPHINSTIQDSLPFSLSNGGVSGSLNSPSVQDNQQSREYQLQPRLRYPFIVEYQRHAMLNEGGLWSDNDPQLQVSQLHSLPNQTICNLSDSALISSLPNQMVNTSSNGTKHDSAVKFHQNSNSSILSPPLSTTHQSDDSVYMPSSSLLTNPPPKLQPSESQIVDSLFGSDFIGDGVASNDGSTLLNGLHEMSLGANDKETLKNDLWTSSASESDALIGLGSFVHELGPTSFNPPPTATIAKNRHPTHSRFDWG